MDSVASLTPSRFVFLVTLVAAPWCIGGKFPNIQQYLFAGVTLSAVFLFFEVMFGRSRKSHFNRHIPLLMIPLTLGLIYATLQYLPLEIPGLQQRYFGYDGGKWATIFDDQETTYPYSVVSLATNQISVCPSESRLISLHLAIGITAFILGSVLFVRSESVSLLWHVVLLNGVALSVFGIIQKVVGSGEAFWIYDLFDNVQLQGDAQTFASFLNRNNASGYLNMVGACGIGLWLLAHATGKKDREIQLMLTKKQRNTPIGKFSGHFRQFVSELRGMKLLAVVLTTIVLSGVVASASRGGIGAMAIGVVALYFALAKRRQWTVANALAVVPTLGIIFVLAYSGLTQNVEDRLDTLTLENFEGSARWKNWQDAWKGFEIHYLWGTGLGTYRFAYLPFQSYPDNHIYYYTENQYLQTALEMGLPGIVLLCAVLLLTVSTLIWFLFAKNRPEFDPIAYCGLFVFVTQFVQAWVDFGLYRTGNMLLCAVLLGSLFGRQAFLRRGKQESKEKTRSGKSGLVIVVFLCMLSSTLATFELYRKAPLEIRTISRELLDSADARDPLELETQIQHLTNALRYRPDDPEAGLLLARLLIYRYRLDFYDDFIRQSNSPSETAKAIAWNSSGMLHFHEQTTAIRQSGNEEARQRLLETESVRQNLVAAYLYLKRADEACPIMPRVKLLLAQLGPLMGESKSQVEEWIRQAANLNAVDPELQYVAGYLAFQERMNDECTGYWKQALSLERDGKRKEDKLRLSNKYLLSIYQAARLRWSPEYIVQNIFPEKPHTLIRYARFDINRHQKKENTLQGISSQEIQLVVQLLAEKVAKIYSAREAYEMTGNDYRLYAHSARLRNRQTEAIKHFENAVETSSLDVIIRYEFAQYLLEIGKPAEAEKHAKMCTQLNSREKKYKQLEATIIKLILENPSKENPEMP